MESVIDALKAMGKATYLDVAARLDIEPVEALKMLREQKEEGCVISSMDHGRSVPRRSISRSVSDPSSHRRWWKGCCQQCRAREP
jgi:hypothetical protein